MLDLDRARLLRREDGARHANFVVTGERRS
jgi:hypothetical protein